MRTLPIKLNFGGEFSPNVESDMQFGVSVLGSVSLIQQLCPFEKVILSAH